MEQLNMIERDEYLDVINEHWDAILMWYKRFEDKKPVMLFDIQDGLIYSYPYKEYSKTLSKRSPASLKKQYEEANANGQFVVFIRDNEKRKLRSYSLRKE